MKKFNFIINNFYSIFNPMPEDKKNIDSFLDQQIRKSLYKDISSEFTYELMKRVELEKEFAKEDFKTDNLVKYIIGGLMSLLVAFTLIFSLVLYKNTEEKEVSYFNNIVEKFIDFLERGSSLVFENLGFNFNFQTGLIIFLIMICVFLFSFADKIIFKKTLK